MVFTKADEVCGTCKYYNDLVLWNLEGKDLPNYRETSHCCTLFLGEGVVHQANSPWHKCECWERSDRSNE